MTTEKRVKVAVIGESASGKSEFIRSFSNNPRLIESVGEGQTTRSYAEYDFVITGEDKPLVASVWLLSEKEFVRRRTEQVITLLSKLEESEELSLSWMAEQVREYRTDIDNIFLYATDFFNIKEFDFLDDALVREISNTYESMCKHITSAQENGIFTSPPSWMNDLHGQVSQLEAHYNHSQEDDEEEQDDREEKFLESAYKLFFTSAYRRIRVAMDGYLREELGYELLEKDTPLFLNITPDNKDKLALFLKVVKGDEHKSMYSLSGMVSKIKISGAINRHYYEDIKDLGIDSVLLVDTYGLDHAQAPDTEYLEKRYQQLFNDDYPDLDAVLFVKKIQSSSDKTFSNELKALYTIKPNLMTYVVGTHIDAQDSNLLKSKQDWLLSKEKTNDYPVFSGKVMELIYDNDTIANVLKRNKVPGSLAENRLNVMRSRFAPFCGNVNTLMDGELVSIMQGMSTASVSSVLTSISDREHLGSGYINIDALCTCLKDPTLLAPFSKQFIQNLTQRFKSLYSSSGPRTKWRIRVNIEEYKVMGYHGSMTDATWYRAFNDAYNLTFTKQIRIDAKSVTLSDVYALQGNEKLAFDELMTGFFPFAFSRACQQEPLSPWQHELDCSKFPSCSSPNTCMWGILLNIFYTSCFLKYKQSKYGRVIDWLEANHNFNLKCDQTYYSDWSTLFLQRMNSDFIKLCRNHNLKVAAIKAKRSKESFLETKETLYQEYSRGFDSRIERQDFFKHINML